MNAPQTVTGHATLRITCAPGYSADYVRGRQAFGATTSLLRETHPTEEDQGTGTPCRRLVRRSSCESVATPSWWACLRTTDGSAVSVSICERQKAGSGQATISIPSQTPASEPFGRDLDLWRPQRRVIDAQSEAYLFRKQGKRWELIGAFGRSDPVTTLGASVAYSNGFMARSIQAYRINEDESQAELPGVVRVYQQCERGIRRVATLRASDAAPTDRFGVSLAMDRGVLVVGAPGLGAAYVFVGDGNRWVQRQKLVSSDGGVGDFGTSVAIRNGMILVGAPEVDVPGEERDPDLTRRQGLRVSPVSGQLVRIAAVEQRRTILHGLRHQRGAEPGSGSSGVTVRRARVLVRSAVLAFDRIGAELTSGQGVIWTGNDGASVSDVDASERRIVAGVQESPNFGGPQFGSVRIVELGAPGADAEANLDAPSAAAAVGRLIGRLIGVRRSDPLCLPSQAQRVADDGHRGQAHRERCDQRAQQPARHRIEHAGSDRNPQRVVAEREAADSGGCCAPSRD